MVSSRHQELFDAFPHVGKLEWIGLRPARRQPMQVVNEVKAVAGTGLEGDRAGARSGGKRQVTLIQAEHLPIIAGLTHKAEVQAQWLRRNLVVSGINLRALKDQRFYVGDALMEGTGYCSPCAYMEEVLGEGGFNAMRGHGGLTAKVLSSGTIRLDDSVRFALDITTEQ